MQLTPLFAYFFIYNRPLRSQLICSNCGNTESERSVCGVYGNDILKLDK